MHRETDRCLSISKSANAYCISFCKNLAKYGDQWARLTVSADKIEEEQYFLTKEVDEILSAVYDLGTDDLAESIVQAFDKGMLDVPSRRANMLMGQYCQLVTVIERLGI